MPQDPDALTDDELKAINDSGDASLMRQLSPEERRRLSALSYRPDPTMQAETARAIGRRQGLGGGWTRPPVVDELGRPLQSTEPGTYAGGFLKSIKDQILGGMVGNPALEAAARPGASGTWLDTASDLSSLMLPTAPGALQGARQGARDVRATLSKPADVILDTLVKKTGIDPDAISLAATKKRLEMTRSRARQMRLRDEIATLEQQQRGMGGKPATPAETPLELTRRLRAENQARQTASGLDPRISGLPPGETPAPSVSGPQGVPASAVAPNASDRAAVMTAANPRATPPEPIPEVPKTPRAKRSAAAAPPPAATPATAGPSMSSLEASLVAESGLSRQEARQALQWLEQGIPPEQIQQRIVDSRALMESPTFANLPTPEEPSAATRRGRPAPMSPALPPSEQMIYDALINRGKTPAEALAHLEAARTLSGRLGTPSVERMVDRTELRNKTGRWPPE